MAQTDKTLCLTDRSLLYINDVTEVQSFDECGAVLTTQRGELTVEGSGIHIARLDIEGGVAELTGKIDALYYADESATKKRSLRAKLFG